jgi:hypothetical protein
MAAYQWKLPLYSVEAQTAGDELQRIYDKNGALRPAEIVEESKPVQAPLHPCFEWNDQEAARKYRENQAEGIVRNITIVQESVPQAAPVRAFVHVQKAYHPLEIVLQSADATQELLESAMRDLDAFQTKYSTLQALRPVFNGIEEVKQHDIE